MKRCVMICTYLVVTALHAQDAIHPTVDEALMSAKVAQNCVAFTARGYASTTELPQDIADAALSECHLQRAAAMSDRSSITGGNQDFNRQADEELRRIAIAAVLESRHPKKR